jgi:hypothetical protein
MRPWYFADDWTRWRPDDAWTTPALPAGLTWDIDLISQ